MEDVMNIDKTTFTTSSSRLAQFLRHEDIFLTANPDIWDAPAGFGGFGVVNYRVFAGDGNDTVHAGAGQDEVHGGNGEDKLFGEGGNDTLYGEADRDFLDGGLGADVMFGGTEGDTYVVDNSGDKVVENANEGFDDVWSFLASYTLPANVDNMYMRGTAITGNGNDLANKIYGNGEANFINGWGQDDQLFGAGGNDWISGDDGNDLIMGGDGRDDLIGGTGADVFLWSNRFESGVSISTMDRIHDFNPLEGDKINLQMIDANETATGPNNESFKFIGSGAFDAPGQIRFDWSWSTNELFIWLNTDNNPSTAEMGIIVPFTGVMPDASWFVA
jgi:Ca2+-binding RTX toxin-like protein